MSKRRRPARKAPILPGDIRMTAIKRRKLNKVAFVLMCLCFLSAAYHLYPAYQTLQPQSQPQKQAQKLKAIIITENATLYPLPSILSGDHAVTASTGVEVVITNQADGWFQIQTEAGKYWIESAHLLLGRQI
ncbi:MAG: hypothetical protein ACI9TY_000369 [Alphaproteobacteria bacterium]|jgi:hypothetical protein